MPTTRRQKKARKSRGIEMLSDIENLDIMLGENHFNRNERDESVSSNFGRRPHSASADELENNGENRYSATRDIKPSDNAECGRISTGGNSSAEINKLSSELNSRLSRELDDMMCSVNSQIQRAISDAIGNQILPQIQSALSAGSGHLTQNRWNVPSERPEVNSEGLQNINPKDSSASKLNCNRQNNGIVDPNAYDRSTFSVLQQNSAICSKFIPVAEITILGAWSPSLQALWSVMLITLVTHVDYDYVRIECLLMTQNRKLLISSSKMRDNIGNREKV